MTEANEPTAVIVYAYGHYDSRGGTTFICAESADAAHLVYLYKVFQFGFWETVAFGDNLIGEDFLGKYTIECPYGPPPADEDLDWWYQDGDHPNGPGIIVAHGETKEFGIPDPSTPLMYLPPDQFQVTTFWERKQLSWSNTVTYAPVWVAEARPNLPPDTWLPSWGDDAWGLVYMEGGIN